MTLPRIGASSLLVLRSKYIPPHLQSHYPRCACFGIVVYRQQRNESVSNHFYRTSSTSTSSSPSSAAICKLHQKILLPQHGQNGTLLLRSDSKSIGQVDIIPQWRDDTMLELIPIVVISKDKEDGSNDGNATKNNSSSIHDHESSAVMEVQYDHDDDESSSSSTVLEKQQTISYGGLKFTLHRDGISTALGRKGSFVEVDVDIDDGNLDDTPVSSLSQLWKLVATVPEKSNITCKITKGHINVIGSKLEGDVHLATSDGDIKVSKLRGHDVALLNNCVDVDRNTTTSCSSTTPGLIYVQKGIEAKTVRISSSNRIRARMVNGSDVSVQVVVPSTSSVTEQEEQSIHDDNNNKMDEDDAGCRIDIGSLYISGSSECEARLNVDESDSSSTPGLVRIKSSHGHVMVHAKAKLNASLLTEVKQQQQQQQPQPLVDLGGVNGSCDVTLEVGADGSDAKVISPIPHEEAPVTTRVHFDSLSPDSISTITSLHFGRRSDEAIVSVTVDRKVEADLRLLALNNGAESMPIDMDRLTSDELDDVESALLDIERYIQKSGSYNNASKTTESIYIETEAFDPMSNKNKKLPESECFQYKQGTIRNRSGEPDSRFDIRSSSSPSRGKINIDSAASQALSGFQGKKNDSDNFTADDNSHLPLLAVATNGKIKLETLSWLGAIARRYGLEGQQELGRTASRRPRLS